MKHLKLFLALLALFTLGGSNLFAQTDVTSTYLTNADFSQSTAIDNHVCGYRADMSKNGTTYCNMQAVDGWEFGVANGDTKGGAVFAYGSTPQLKGNNVAAPSAGPNGEEGNCLGLFAVWTGTVQYVQAVTLPAGKYKISIPVYSQSGSEANKSLMGFIADNGTTYTVNAVPTAGSWITETVEFTLAVETSGKISLGYVANNVGSGKSPHLFIDGVKIEYTDPLQAAKDALQAEIEKATSYNTELQNSDLTQAIATAQEAKNIATTETELATAIETMKAAVITALTETDGAVTTTTDLFVVNPSFETGQLSPWTANNANDTGVKPNSNGTYTTNGVDGDYLFNTWGGTAEKYVKQTLTGLPEGYYTITASVASDAGNKVTLFAGSAQVEQEVSADGKGQFVDGTTPKTYVAADGSLEIGAKSTNWYKVDNFRLTYYTVTAGARDAWLAAKAAAEAARDDAAYVNVTGVEKAALLEEIAKAEPTTAEEYGAATTALQEATAAFTNAKTNYDAFVAAQAIETPELKYASNDKKIALNDAKTATATSATDADTKTAAIITALRAYYESHALAEGVEGAVNMTDKIANATDPTNNESWTWTGNKNIPASNEPWTDADGTNNHSYFDGGNWGANSWTTTMKQTVNIPAGKYLLTAKARAAANVTFTMTAGEASVELPHIGSTGNVFDRGWGDASVEFETDGNPAEILVSASTSTQYEWFSISDFRLVQLEAIEVPMADADDYAALATAITAAEGNVLGFDADEYAPYNNVAALQALAAAKAINPEAEDGNTKELVNNVTTALTAATWTANTEEVNAVHNGMFATVQEGANYPEGWNRTNAWGQMQSNIAGDYATAYYNQPGSLKYGENGVYTMPLKENTVYVLNFAYRSHENNSNNNVTVSVLNGEDGVKDVVCPGNGSTTEWKTGSVVFTTGAAGNYVLTLANSGNTWMTNVSIFKAQSVDITVKEGFTATTYSNADYALDFSNTEGLTAYLINDAEGTEEEVSNVPAGTGVYVKANPGTYKAYILATSTTNVENNKLVGTGSEPTSLTSDKSTTYYVFGRQGTPKKEAFYKVKTDKGTTVSAGKAYLKIDIPAPEAKDAIFVGGGDTTGINAIEGVDMQNGDIYNLQGQKVNRAQKGVYIVNGKKIVLK